MSLRDWTVLAQSPPKVLLVHGTGGEPLLALVRTIAKAMDASVTILADSSERKGEDVRKEVEERTRGRGLEEVEVVTGTGELGQQVALQSANALFDLVIVPRSLKSSKRGLSDEVASLLERIDLPTIIVGSTVKEPISRMLLCTRAGEPGKSDILIGGRLARYLNARVTLLHVMRPGRQAQGVIRRHLDQASSTLRGLEVENEVRLVENADPATVILSEAAAHDLVVIGGHGASAKSVFGREDISSRVLSGAKCPVLVVPVEW